MITIKTIPESLRILIKPLKPLPVPLQSQNYQTYSLRDSPTEIWPQMPKWGSSKYYSSHCLEGKNIHGSPGSANLSGKIQSTVQCTRSVITHNTTKDIGLPLPGYPALSTNIMARIWNTVPGLQHASTLGAAKSLATKWAKDIPRWTSILV